MSVRVTTRKLIGTVTKKFETSLGIRDTGNPGVTVRYGYGNYFCLDDPDVVIALMADLSIAHAHLSGE